MYTIRQAKVLVFLDNCVVSYVSILFGLRMKTIAFFVTLLASYVASASGPGSFDFDIPQQAKNRAVIPAPAIPVETKPVLQLPFTVVKSTTPASTVVPIKPSAEMSKPSIPIEVAPGVLAVAPSKTTVVDSKAASVKETYRLEEVSKHGIKHVANSGKLCSPKTIAMTFHNVPTQKGPYFHRWVSLGCEADEVNFVREGNEQYSMNWKLAYVPADDNGTARYSLHWKIKGKDDKGVPVDYEAHHTFNLRNARTLSLTNNMAVSLRKVP